jgi:hypothetical protein
MAPQQNNKAGPQISQNQVSNNCHLMVCVAEMAVHSDLSARAAQVGKRGNCACAAEAPAHPKHSHIHLWKIYSTIKKI